MQDIECVLHVCVAGQFTVSDSLWALLVLKNDFRGPRPIHENHEDYVPRKFGAIRYAIMGKFPTMTGTAVEVGYLLCLLGGYVIMGKLASAPP